MTNSNNNPFPKISATIAIIAFLFLTIDVFLHLKNIPKEYNRFPTYIEKNISSLKAKLFFF